MGMQQSEVTNNAMSQYIILGINPLYREIRKDATFFVIFGVRSLRANIDYRA